MIRISINEPDCLLSRNKLCRNCVIVCPGNVLGIRDNRVTVLHPEACISCHCCKSACPAGLDAITVDRVVPLGSGDLPKVAPIWEGLSVKLGALTLRSPLIVASGPVGRCGQGWFHSYAAGCGAVVTKTNTPLPWSGNPAVRLLPHGKDSLLNCEGLPNLGAEATAKEIKLAKSIAPSVVIIGSMTAISEDEFVDIASRFEASGADGLEVALMGCPNYRPGTAISQGHWIEDPKRAFSLVSGIRKAVKIPLWIKGAQTANIARACEDAGADALLVRSGSLRALALDEVTGKPILSHPRGEASLTGPYTKLPGLKVVSDMARVVKIPIIGNGGITTGQDIIDYVRAGATAVELLTVMIRRKIPVIGKILSETEVILKAQGHPDLTAVRGTTLRYLG